VWKGVRGLTASLNSSSPSPSPPRPGSPSSSLARSFPGGEARTSTPRRAVMNLVCLLVVYIFLYSYSNDEHGPG
jgi:hypothetical protein